MLRLIFVSRAKRIFRDARTRVAARPGQNKEVLGMNKRMFATLALVGASALTLAGCAGDDPTSSDAPTTGGGAGDEVIVVGFAQTGSESGWRSANTESMKEAFSAENGFELIF